MGIVWQAATASHTKSLQATGAWPTKVGSHGFESRWGREKQNDRKRVLCLLRTRMMACKKVVASDLIVAETHEKDA